MASTKSCCGRSDLAGPGFELACVAASMHSTHSALAGSRSSAPTQTVLDLREYLAQNACLLRWVPPDKPRWTRCNFALKAVCGKSHRYSKPLAAPPLQLFFKICVFRMSNVLLYFHSL